MTTCYSQRDPAWAEDQLGNGRYTMRQAGCCVTAAASVLRDAGVPTDPGKLNAWLTDNHGYVDDDLFEAQSIESWGVTLTRFIECSGVAAPVADLRAALLAGAYIIAEVDFTPKTRVIEPHYVRLLGLSGNTALCVDPWRLPCTEPVDLLDEYGRAQGWDAARAIFQALVYTAGSPRTITHRGPCVVRKHIRG